jgi:polysaccharide biosynthesis protein PslJ
VRTRESPELRSLLWVVVAYQACLIPTLIYNPYSANVVEWVHEAFLVGGSLLVGWVVGRGGRARGALSAYLLGCTFLALWACLQAPRGHFQPVYLPTFQKNALGDLLAFAAIVAYARPSWLAWTARSANAVVLICLFGMLASQSKQAIVSAAVGIALIVMRRRSFGRRSRLVLLSLVPLLAIAWVVTAHQLASSNQFNAAHQRLTFYRDSLNVWDTSKWLGVGMRWWYTDRFPVSFQPPNAEFEMLTSAGILGLAGFLVTSVAAVWLLWRLPPAYGGLAVAVVVARLAQGQLDLFWVASQSSIPWLIVGSALGVQSLDRAAAAARRTVPTPVEPSSRAVR